MTEEGSTSSPAGGLAATTFFGKTYDEAYALLVDARDYVEFEAPKPSDWSRPMLGLVHCREAMRVTTRLTQIMAWIMAQRAVHAGEIAFADRNDARWKLDARELCFDMGGELSADLPVRLRDLLTRSRKLYMRIARLDDMVRRDGARPTTPAR